MWLMGINIGVFVIAALMSGSLRGDALGPTHWGYFSVDKAIYSGQIWRFLTYQFLHAGFLHLLFNMIGLYFFGPLMESWLGSRRFLAFYLLCGSSGFLIATLLGLIPGLHILPAAVPVVGASGSIYGILAGCATLFPHQRVMLIFPPVELSMKTMALIFLGLAAFAVIVGSTNQGGQAVHLGGALGGYLLARRPSALNWADRVPVGGVKKLRRAVETKRRERADDLERRHEAEVDRILVKISREGMGHLTAAEKRTLKRDTNQKRGGGT